MRYHTPRSRPSCNAGGSGHCSIYWFSKDPATENPTGTAHLGTRIHLALQAYYGYQIDPIKVLHYIYDQVINYRQDWVDELVKERDLALVMAEGYLEWVETEGIDIGFEVLDTEHEVKHELVLPSGEHVILRGKLDQLVRRTQDGALQYRDFKTVGTRAKANLLQIDTQMPFYAMLESLSSDEQRVDGGYYTMLMRSKRTPRATGPFYEQIHVAFNRHQLNSTWLRTREVVSDMLKARERLLSGEDFRIVGYASPGDYCSWACPFTHQCIMFDDGSRAWDAVQGTFIKQDPYARYNDTEIEKIREAFTRTGI